MIRRTLDLLGTALLLAAIAGAAVTAMRLVAQWAWQ